METTLIKRSAFFADSSLDLQEYMIVIEPDLQVYNKVLLERRAFEMEYGELTADTMNRYIKVADFQGHESIEETLIRWIGRICRLHQTFSLSFNNYSGFPQHAIYLRLQEIEPLYALFRQLRVIDGLTSSSGGSPLQAAARPHLIVARHLSTDVYNKAIIDYAQKTFHESFEVNQLLLIKVDHVYGTAKLVNVFGFTPATNAIKL